MYLASGGANAPQIPSSSTGGRSTFPRPHDGHITDGPLGLPPPAPHHTAISAKFHTALRFHCTEKVIGRISGEPYTHTIKNFEFFSSFLCSACNHSLKVIKPPGINPFAAIRRHWRPPLFLPNGAIRHQWCPNKKV